MTDLRAATPITAQTDPRDPRWRLGALLDAGSVLPLHAADELSAVTVRGRIEGQAVVAFCTDATRKGGAIGAAECQRIADSIDLARQLDCPVIGLWHSGGARLGEGIEAMDGIGKIFAAMVCASGKVPQISVVLGPAAGGAAYGPALTDMVIFAPAARVFVTGPDVVRSVTGERTGMEGLGGPDVHARKSGVAHIVASSEQAAYDRARNLVKLIAARRPFDPSLVGERADLRALIPASRRRAYDIRDLFGGLLDCGTFEELHRAWAPNVVTGLGCLADGTIGVVANNPLRKGGCLDSLSTEKASRFVRMCDSLSIPLLVVVDVPGFLPGVGQEWGGVVRRGAKLLYAFAEATVPRFTLITRKSYGGAYIAMNSRSLGATGVFAWPDAEAAIIGPESAVEIVYRKQLEAAPEGARPVLRHELVEEQRRLADGIQRGMALGMIDEIIDPRDTRHRLAQAFADAPSARGHHGNIPL